MVLRNKSFKRIKSSQAVTVVKKTIFLHNILQKLHNKQNYLYSIVIIL